MADDPENHTLVWMRRLDGKIDQMLQIQTGHGHRLARIELGLARVLGAVLQGVDGPGPRP